MSVLRFLAETAALAGLLGTLYVVTVFLAVVADIGP
jgi:hypothetical protein